MLGQVGKVLKVYADGDLRVAFGGQTWTFNPACLAAQPAEVDANLMTAENPNESGSKASAGTRGLNSSAAASPSFFTLQPAFYLCLCFACFLMQAATLLIRALLFLPPPLMCEQGVCLFKWSLRCSTSWSSGLTARRFGSSADICHHVRSSQQPLNHNILCLCSPQWMEG